MLHAGHLWIGAISDFSFGDPQGHIAPHDHELQRCKHGTQTEIRIIREGETALNTFGTRWKVAACGGLSVIRLIGWRQSKRLFIRFEIKFGTGPKSLLQDLHQKSLFQMTLRSSAYGCLSGPDPQI